mgnify:CR=1 FL=1
MIEKQLRYTPTLFILVMGANAEICKDFTFEDEFNLALDTWAKELPDNIAIVYYDGGAYMKSEFKQYKNHKNVWHLHLACEDDMNYTFKKTWMAYNFISNKYSPDWIFRTNTSTYVNIRVLNDFITRYADPEITYGSDLYSLSEACCPYPLCIYPRGNGILTSKEVYTKVIVRNGISFAYQTICDDIVFGNLINTYNINNGRKYIDYIAGLPHAWYKCVDQLFDNGHKFSKFGDSNLNYNDFVTITVKKYREREKEKEHYLELHEKIKSDHLMNIVETIWTNEMLEYVEDPSIFVGSVLGYIDIDKWKAMDKNMLFLEEISHKASDDAEHYKYKEIQGYNFFKNILK